MKRKVSVSFLSSKRIYDDLVDLEYTNCDYIHVDVMDGKFVKNKNLPYGYLDDLSYIMRKRLDVHLMVNKPNKYIEQYANLNTEFITVHVELNKDIINESIENIKGYGIKVGLAINPDTDINLLEEYLDKIDLVLIMSVYPGLGGQKFIEETTNRITKIKEMIKKSNRKILINVDGGINKDTVSMANGADIVVSGSYIINSDNYQDVINTLR